MVYCGKPSAGCQACREKKTRCDRVTPSCTQCVRAQRVCPGYRNQLDLMFRNESDAVIGKVKAKQKKTEKQKIMAKGKISSSSSSTDTETTKTSPSSPDSLTPLHITAQSSPSGWASEQLAEDLPDIDRKTLDRRIRDFTFIYHYDGPCISLPPTLQERSRGYFYTNSSMWLRNFDLLGTLYNQTNTDEYLLACMSAVGLAGLSNATRAPELMLHAQKDYITALRLTNEALRSPDHVKKDSTLFSVMILSIFETITGTDTKSLGAWTKHIYGAAALVKLRGTKQFSTEAGQRMFLQIFSGLMISCIQRSCQMPPDIVKLRTAAEKYLDPTKPGWQLSGIIIDVTSFRGTIQNCELTAPREIVERALELDARFLTAQANLPAEFQFETMYDIKRPKVVWDGYYHQYQNCWIAQIWNGMRVCRIILHENIRDQLLVGATANVPIFLPEEYNLQDTASISILLQLQADILASVPQHLAVADGKENVSLLDGSQGYFILWPLYLVGVMDMCSVELKEWVVRRLDDMAENVGVKQASVLAGYIRERRPIPEWNIKPDPRLGSTVGRPRIVKFFEGGDSELREVDESWDDVVV